ncbi:MAG TPA: carbamoyltransferase, partial [Candidatus Atribacteria bacterium]|nr:carbamoyltransferase [Candidatus Atribacteria bacterium]
MYILGINAYHGDSSACLIKDGSLITAVEEERFRRIKHWAGFPEKAVKHCLWSAGLGLEDIDYIAINRNPKANLYKKVLFTLRKRPSFVLIKDSLKNALKVKDIKIIMSERLGMEGQKIKAELYHIEHHRAHMASAFFVSPFEGAAILSIDGFGDFVSTMMGIGEGNKIEVIDQVNFPHSLGLFYTALTQYLGVPKYGDEYKVMGLSAYGRPIYLKEMEEIVRLKQNGRFELNL